MEGLSKAHYATPPQIIECWMVRIQPTQSASTQRVTSTGQGVSGTGRGHPAQSVAGTCRESNFARGGNTSKNQIKQDE